MSSLSIWQRRAGPKMAPRTRSKAVAVVTPESKISSCQGQKQNEICSPETDAPSRSNDNSSNNNSCTSGTPVLSFPTSPSSSQVERMVDDLLSKAGIDETRTKGDWCLREGLIHVCKAHQGSLIPLVQQHGPPTFYHVHEHCRHVPKNNNNNNNNNNSSTNQMKAPSNCFQSLCRIIAGQQLAGKAAQAVWQRLLQTTHPDLTPAKVLALADRDLHDCLQKPAGLSQAKARAVVDLAQHFVRGDLGEEFLLSSSTSQKTESEIREALVRVRGVGPWSCDMFLMFALERPNVLPLGDLGVRKGLARHFFGNKIKKDLFPKKDADRIRAAVAPFAPYHSLLSFYMWKVADTVDFYNDDAVAQSSSTFRSSNKRKREN